MKIRRDPDTHSIMGIITFSDPVSDTVEYNAHTQICDGQSRILCIMFSLKLDGMPRQQMHFTDSENMLCMNINRDWLLKGNLTKTEPSKWHPIFPWQHAHKQNCSGLCSWLHDNNESIHKKLILGERLNLRYMVMKHLMVFRHLCYILQIMEHKHLVTFVFVRNYIMILLHLV